MTGRWAEVGHPDGSVRQDWVPAEQPPSPDGTTGEWHVVEEQPGQPTRWEWYSTPTETATLQMQPPVDVGTPGLGPEPPGNSRPPGPPDDSRAALVVGLIWGAFVALLPGVREPLMATGDKVADEGSVGHALLLAILVAVYVVGAWVIARLFARPFGRGPVPN